MGRNISRRRLLQVAGAGLGWGAFGWSAVASAERGETRTAGSPTFPGDPFILGVASGDPTPDGVVLWTRLAPDPLAADGRGGMGDAAVPVRWEVASDDGFRRVVARGTTRAAPALGHSVHAEVDRLKPGHEYFYRFRAGREISPVGRTRTAPAANSRPDSLKLALASCQSWAGGRYAAYRAMVEDDPDLVIHVGDYIYENGGTETLTDFRLIHSLYKTSPDLQAAHATAPFVVTVDDHEIENNWAEDESQPDGEASNARFLALRAAAFQAYYENLPLRRPARPAGPDMRVYRRLRYGTLAEINVLDTRQYRDDQLAEGFPSGPLDPRSADPGRDFLGPDQERWLYDGLDRSRARWNVLAQQTIMAHYDYDTSAAVAVNHDQWDGYIGARDRLVGYVGERRPDNPVVVSGDWHSSWVNDVKADHANQESETLLTEFVGTSISSGCGWAGQVAAAVSVNPQVKFFDGAKRGYVRCTVTPDEWRSDFQVVTSANDTADPSTTLTSWVVENGRAGAVPA